MQEEGVNLHLTLKVWEDAANDSWIDPELVEKIHDPVVKALFKQYKLAYQAGKASKN